MNSASRTDHHPVNSAEKVATAIKGFFQRSRKVVRNQKVGGGGDRETSPRNESHARSGRPKKRTRNQGEDGRGNAPTVADAR